MQPQCLINNFQLGLEVEWAMFIPRTLPQSFATHSRTYSCPHPDNLFYSFSIYLLGSDQSSVSFIISVKLSPKNVLTYICILIAQGRNINLSCCQHSLVPGNCSSIAARCRLLGFLQKILKGLAAERKAKKNTRWNCQFWVQLGSDVYIHRWNLNPSCHPNPTKLTNKKLTLT